jgi:hypothetical protein
MKKLSNSKPLVFKDQTNQQMVDQLNAERPISLKYNIDLVNRVHARYPLLEKSEVAIIIKAVFVSLRDLLVLGKILNFNNLFFNMRILIFSHRRNGVIFPAIKVALDTPAKIKGKL